MEASVAAVLVQEQHHELVPQLQLPPGYHFVPTEQELLSYLRDKIEGREQTLAIVNEVAILDWQPGSLVDAYKGYGESKWYFFTVREPSSSNKEEEPNRKVRVPGVKATWKATGSVAPIAAARASRQDEGGEPAADEEEEVIVGTKRVLIYQSSDAEEDGKWSMHEYILKGHAKIGQYALLSIQRKQHSDTSSSSRKRSKATNADPGKARKRRTKKPSTQPEQGLHLQQLQETASVEAPLKPKSRTRRSDTKGKNKASVQDDERQQQQDQVVASVSPAKPPLTPPQQAPPQALQQQHMALAVNSALPAAPLHGCPSHPTEHEEGTIIASTFQYDDDIDMPLPQDLSMLFWEQNEQPQSFADNEFIAVSHAQYQHCYQQDTCNMFGVHKQDDCNMFGVHSQQLQYSSGNITQKNSSWNHGQLQNYQQEIGCAFAAPDLQHTDAQCYGQSPHMQMHYSSLLPQTGHCSSDQFTASGSDGNMGLTAEELFALGFLRDNDPQDCVGTQDGSNNPQAFQSQDESLCSCGQQQRGVSEFWER